MRKKERIEFIKRSSKDAEDHMKKMKIPYWIETQKAEVEDGNENGVSTNRTLDKQDYRLEPWSGHQDQSKQISWKTKKMGRRHQRVLEGKRNRLSERKRNEK